MTEIAVVILNWNTRAFLEQFLPVILKHSASSKTEVWVADNASNDGSIELVKTCFPEVKIIEFDKNYGYTGGYNRALSAVNAKYYMLLNSDVEVTANWLDPLYSLMEKNPKTGACTPKLRSWYEKNKFEYAGAAGGFIDYLGYPFCQGRIFDFLEDDTGQFDKGTSIFWATGACMLVRAEVFHALGGFDEILFAHMEEIDLCWRMKRLGYNVQYCPESVVFHIGGGTLSRQNPWKTFLNFRNNLILVFKNVPSKKLWVKFLAKLVLDGISALRFMLRGDFADFLAVFRAHLAFYRLIPHYRNYRKLNDQKAMLNDFPEIYPRSIVFSFFVKKIKKFNDLKGWK